MSWSRDLLRLIQDRAVFFREFLKHPQQIGSVAPSSRYLEHRVVEAGAIDRARLVVELGPGTGGITRAILAALPPGAALLSLDINPNFCDRIRQIDDQRLIVHCGDALQLRDVLAEHRLPAPDAVVSGIPFSTLDRETGTALLDHIARLLPPGGRFVAYQFRNRVEDLARPLLGDPHVRLELLCIPPQRVFSWRIPARPTPDPS